jgi:hypothetical protein
MTKNEWSYTDTAATGLHKMHSNSITDFKFITKQHAFTYLKKDVITLQSTPTSSLTFCKWKNERLNSSELLELQVWWMKGVAK